MVRLLYADVSPLARDALFEEYFARASRTRQEKICRYRLRSDRNLSLGATILLDRGLALLGGAEKDAEYDVCGNGKPIFRNDPDVHFNVSHSGTKVLVAFSDAEVGCDIERIADLRVDIAAHFHPDERALLERLPADEERNALLFRLWTLKESFMKACGQGFALPLPAFEVRITPEKVFVECDRVQGHFAFREISTIPGYAAAVCVRDGEFPEKMIPEEVFL